jgi:hypothetical protein
MPDSRIHLRAAEPRVSRVSLLLSCDTPGASPHQISLVQSSFANCLLAICTKRVIFPHPSRVYEK